MNEVVGVASGSESGCSCDVLPCVSFETVLWSEFPAEVTVC